jgi:hypothetical protein
VVIVAYPNVIILTLIQLTNPIKHRLNVLSDYIDAITLLYINALTLPQWLVKSRPLI